MGQPAVQLYTAEWRPRGRARFERVVLNQTWKLTCEPNDYVTITQAALLLRISEQVVGDWVRDRRLDPAFIVHFPDSGAVTIRLDLVRAIYDYRSKHGQVPATWIMELSGDAAL